MEQGGRAILGIVFSAYALLAFFVAGQFIARADYWPGIVLIG